MRTAPVLMTSLRLSAAVASRVAERISRPTWRLKAAIQNFTRMEAARIRMDAIPVVMGSGERIFWMLVFASSAPMSRIITLTASPERYSVRPCP